MNKNQNKDQQNQPETGNKNKGNQKDISNNLEKNAVGKTGSKNPTPQARTDNEQQDNIENDKNGNWRL